VRPATPLICEFITERRQEFGGAPICRALSTLGVPITPRTYWAQVARPRPSALWDATITELLAGSMSPMSRAAGLCRAKTRHMCGNLGFGATM
jgi:hypothetical protein